MFFSLDLTRRTVTCKVSQGSVRDPAQRNICYDKLLGIPLLAGVHLVAFADDVAVVATAHMKVQLEGMVNLVLERVTSWTSINGLRVVTYKTEPMLLIKKLKYDAPELVVNGHRVNLTSEIPWCDTGTEDDIHQTCLDSDKVDNGLAVVGQDMPNMCDSGACRRTVLASVHSKILYASSIWTEAKLATVKIWFSARCQSGQSRPTGPCLMKTLFFWPAFCPSIFSSGKEPISEAIICREKNRNNSRDQGKKKGYSFC